MSLAKSGARIARSKCVTPSPAFSETSATRPKSGRSRAVRQSPTRRSKHRCSRRGRQRHHALPDTVDAYQARDELAPQHYEDTVTDAEASNGAGEKEPTARASGCRSRRLQRQARVREASEYAHFKSGAVDCQCLLPRTKSTIRAETWRGAATPEPNGPEARSRKPRR